MYNLSCFVAPLNKNYKQFEKQLQCKRHSLTHINVYISVTISLRPTADRQMHDIYINL